MSPAPSAFLFDWDNTLVDTWVAIHAALETTFTAMGQEPWTLEQCKERVRASARDAFPPLFGERAAEATEIFYAAFRASHLEQLRPYPGAVDLLERLASAGLAAGVVSNKAGPLLRAEVAALGWQAYFTALVGANDAARDKPAADAPFMALEAMGKQASEAVWFVGDTDIDMLCAVNSGCLPVLLRQAPPGPTEFPDCTPRHHVRSAAELSALIFGR
ncbi:MAG: HAD hydrolase-like protein [Pseudomonadota bacterium]